MSPAALLEIEEKTQELIPLDRISTIVDQIFSLDVSNWDDQSLEDLEGIIDKLIALLSSEPSAQHRPLIERLLVAREGVENGVNPDPVKRPNTKEMRAFVSAHLSN